MNNFDKILDTLLEKEIDEDSYLKDMLDAFLKWSASDLGLYDRRLDIELGLLACKLIDQIEAQYQKLQREWLYRALDTFDPADESLRYGLSEILQLHGAVSPEGLADMLELLGKMFTGEKHHYWLEKLSKSSDHGQLIRELAVRGE